YEDFCKRVDANEDTAIDPYAAEAIDEFFAVCCEVFFEEPELLRAEYAAFYDELARYFALDPVDGVLAR
ncbi:MAG: zinc-dependent peptidase, partial [Casimicrobium sp.]